MEVFVELELDDEADDVALEAEDRFGADNNRTKVVHQHVHAQPISRRMRLTERFDRALLYATHVHGGLVRKGTSTSHVAHLLAVGATVLEYGGSEDMAIAGLLHDAVEDQGGEARLSDIRNRFGDRVADVVRAFSDSTTANLPKEDWRLRKRRYLEHLNTVDEETLLMSLADRAKRSKAHQRLAVMGGSP